MSTEPITIVTTCALVLLAQYAFAVLAACVWHWHWAERPRPRRIVKFNPLVNFEDWDRKRRLKARLVHLAWFVAGGLIATAVVLFLLAH